MDTEQRGTYVVVGDAVRSRRSSEEIENPWRPLLAELNRPGNSYNDCVRERVRKLLCKAASHCVPFATSRLCVGLCPHLPRLTRLREMAALFNLSTPPGICMGCRCNRQGRLTP